MNKYYEQGFLDKCAEYQIDPSIVLKYAATGANSDSDFPPAAGGTAGTTVNGVDSNTNFKGSPLNTVANNINNIKPKPNNDAVNPWLAMIPGSTNFFRKPFNMNIGTDRIYGQ